ncbi:AAA family ATPase [Nonomuraea phyllanthi]|uniref:AAA family ATPase n=1 Tax=Nonomuraea phyllanthi TaxID=2219224 RepID=A0A5C4VRH2_9ACTN|nr:AAA family ATPase [Nonomuraea phyllanthi]KAB8189771.1 AAA family ATPase [Nonomuraea phyllanthi]QFY08727.1 AAA family ATPase [Nonomuraea phyllanthi]
MSPGPAFDRSSFVGRTHELASVRKLLGRSRLLTLTGVGGVGKTRLALRAGELLRQSYPDGVEVVELATLETGDLLEQAVSAALGLRGGRGDLMTLLVDYLAGRRMLLILDNCEHLSAVCARFVERLLREAPRLQVLATSRQSLGVYGEQVLRVVPLPVPGHDETLREIARHDAVRLFVQRAAAVMHDFTLQPGNMASVSRLVQRLDGIPLAIELAAGRLRTLPLGELVRELEERFDLPAARVPAALARHQTLRATIDWSYRLCSDGEQRLWARLSMFAAGADLETAEAVCSGDGIDGFDVLDLLAGLVDKSILVSDGSRYRMPETLRAYGGERLSPDELRWLRLSYVGHYRGLVEEQRIDRMVPEQLERYLMLQRELPNIRVALETCLSDPALAGDGLAAASSMWCFWLLVGSLSEGRYWLERGLELVTEPGRVRAAGLWADSMLALRQGDLLAAVPELEACVGMAREAGDERQLASARRTESVVAFFTCDARRGLALAREALDLHRALGDLDGVILALYVATAYGSEEDPARAIETGEELLELCERQQAQIFHHAYGRLALGVARWNAGDSREAEALVTAATAFTGGINDRWCLTQCLEVLAWISCERGEHDRAAVLLGAAHALWQAVGASPEWVSYHALWHERCVGRSHRELGGAAFTSAFRRGARLGVEHAVAYAIGEPAPTRAAHRRA